MSRIRFYSAGESHGQGLVGIIEGIPAGLYLSEDDINVDLRRRQMGYGRGQRMKIEKDRAEILSGVRFGKTLGSPIAVMIKNIDWQNWKDVMSITELEQSAKEVNIPRPGHADLAGAIKYRHTDVRNVLERASARETVVRVALGSIARSLLAVFDVFVVSHVVQIHSVKNSFSVALLGSESTPPVRLIDINAIADQSSVRCLDKDAEVEMMTVIDNAKEKGNTVGGIFEVAALDLPVGLGSYVHWDRKLDGKIAQAMMSIPAMKGIEIGLGFEAARQMGSSVHDPILYKETTKKYIRSRNHAGGLEGGVTNGMPLVVRVAMKPISTLMQPLDSVNLKNKKKTAAHIERSDVCAVPAASIIGESMLSLVMVDALLEKFGGDSISEIQERYSNWVNTTNE